MTDSTLETEELAAPQSWIEEVCDALGMSREKLDAVKPTVAEIVQKVADTQQKGDAGLTAFMIGFAAAKDGDFSPESVAARANAVHHLIG
nr:hypothetical protein [Actinomycetales bacterium]